MRDLSQTHSRSGWMIALSKNKTTGNELISNEIDSSADYWALLPGDRLTCAIAHASIECINMLPRNPLHLTLITIRFFPRGPVRPGLCSRHHWHVECEAILTSPLGFRGVKLNPTALTLLCTKANAIQAGG